MRIASKSGASCVFCSWNLNIFFSEKVWSLESGVWSQRPKAFLLLTPDSRLQTPDFYLFCSARNDRFACAVSIRAAIFVDEFNIQAERLQFAHEHVEGFWKTWIEISLALHNRFVNLRAPGNVVTLCG